MKPFLAGLFLCACLALAPLSTPAAQALADQIQALEASIREARAMGLDPSMIQQMESMLATARAEQARRGATPDSGPSMAPNQFDVRNARSYGDCGQYSDAQAFGFCQAAAHYYLMYTEIFAREGDTEAARQVHAGHVQTVDNLIQYVDAFMTAPRR